MIKSWIEEHWLKENSVLPFSFIYEGQSSSSLLKAVPCDKAHSSQGNYRECHRLSWEVPDAGLLITCEIVRFTDFPAVEWVLSFKNTAVSDTGLIEDIQVMDVNLESQADNDFVLHYHRGSSNGKSDFEPLTKYFQACVQHQLFCDGGRSSDGTLPFFNLEYDGGGIIGGIGWSGGWIADFQRDSNKGLRIHAGMKHTRLRLRAGEEIRSPRMLMFFWTGNRIDAHNQFRKFILAHHTPQRNGKPVEMPLAFNGWFLYNYGNGVTEENQTAFIRRYVEKKLDVECFWLDAGWYEGVGNWAFDVGNWFAKKSAFPNGLKPVADEAKKHGMGFVLWFEPERVYPRTWLYENHPEWLIFPDERIIERRKQAIPQPEAVLNLGNEEARRWLTDHISTMIRENDITIYRQDFNFDPWDYWQFADEPDRCGITEIRYVEGLYAFWDELLRRHPGLIIDNCASGGRRLDLETISRSVALWRSDFAFDSEGSQSHTLGIHAYLPCCSCGCNSTDPYNFRSNLGAGLCLAWDLEKEDFNVEEARKRIAEFKMLRPLFYGDFYPLTCHEIASDVWNAWQLDRPDLNLGAVLIFRRLASPYLAASFTLKGLDPHEKYEITDWDTHTISTISGEDLTKGITVDLPYFAGSRLWTYRRISD